jgi:HK97 family phage prohead protease
MDKEIRSFTTELRMETRDDGTQTVVGYASVFNTLSENLGGFREQIAPEAFNNVMGDDVRALFNHDPNYVLGRTKSGTLSLGVDTTGLRYEFTPPDTTFARDLTESLKRGDIDQSSFAFMVEADEWDESGDTPIRTITKVSRLLDVSPVTYPAYPDASVGLRSLDAYHETVKPEPVDLSLYHRRLELAEAEAKS